MNAANAAINYDASTNTIYISNETTNISTITSVINNSTIIVETNAPEELWWYDRWGHQSSPRSYIVAAFGDNAHANITNTVIHHLGWSWGWMSVFVPWYINKTTGEEYPDKLLIDMGVLFTILIITVYLIIRSTI